MHEKNKHIDERNDNKTNRIRGVCRKDVEHVKKSCKRPMCAVVEHGKG
jgi:hypothetical protein